MACRTALNAAAAPRAAAGSIPAAFVVLEALGTGTPHSLETSRASRRWQVRLLPPPLRLGIARRFLAQRKRTRGAGTAKAHPGEDADRRWPHTVANRAARKGVVGAAPTFSASTRERSAFARSAHARGNSAEAVPARTWRFLNLLRAWRTSERGGPQNRHWWGRHPPRAYRHQPMSSSSQGFPPRKRTTRVQLPPPALPPRSSRLVCACLFRVSRRSRVGSDPACKAGAPAARRCDSSRRDSPTHLPGSGNWQPSGLLIRHGVGSNPTPGVESIERLRGVTDASRSSKPRGSVRLRAEVLFAPA